VPNLEADDVFKKVSPIFSARGGDFARTLLQKSGGGVLRNYSESASLHCLVSDTSVRVLRRVHYHEAWWRAKF